MVLSPGRVPVAASIASSICFQVFPSPWRAMSIWWVSVRGVNFCFERRDESGRGERYR
jgi:hypothetical protein